MRAWGLEYLGNGILDHLLIRHIALVANEQLVDTLGGVPIDLLKPLLDVVEGLHVRDVVHDADAVRATVVRRCDGAESFLASRIPLEARFSVSGINFPGTHQRRGFFTICNLTVLPSSSIVRIF